VPQFDNTLANEFVREQDAGEDQRGFAIARINRLIAAVAPTETASDRLRGSIIPVFLVVGQIQTL